MSIQASVIVTTYNKPAELELVLFGLSQQATAPFEIIIADDGSNSSTRQLIEQWSNKIDSSIKHCWHEDQGNRKSLICDKAVSMSQGNYLIFLDGDSIPHSHWVHDHVEAARENTVLCGRRVRLGPKISEQLNLEFMQQHGLQNFSKKLIHSALTKDSKRYMLGVRLPHALARLLHYKERRLMGVNFSLPKTLFEKAGGYTNQNDKNLPSLERRREDAQLEIKLLTAYAKRYPLLNRAIVYHIYHEERPANKEINDKIQQHYDHALKQRNLHINKQAN